MNSSEHDVSVAAFSAEAFDARLADLLDGYPAGLFTEKLHRSVESLHRYTLELSVYVLQRLGASSHLCSWRTGEELRRLTAVDPSFSCALKWLLEQGAELRWLEVEDATAASPHERRYRTVDASWSPDLDAMRKGALEIDRRNAATLDLLDYAASVYPDIARAKVSADEALLAPDRVDLWLGYFSNENPTYAVNNWTAACSALWRIGTRRSLRVLEIGAGAGSASDALLGLITKHGLATRLECYIVTEPSLFFRRRAQRELGRRYVGLPLEFRCLDINASWASQGIEERSVDLVYGVNVMHVARDLGYSLSQARRALADDGWLVLGECLQSVNRKPVFPEFVFQLLQSSIRRDAEFRPTPGFLAPTEWIAALNRFGFVGCNVEPDVERITEMCPRFLAGAVCGRRPAAGA